MQKVRIESSKSQNEKQQELIVLNDEDRDLFLESLSNPPKPNERLKTALKEHRRLFPSLNH